MPRWSQPQGVTIRKTDGRAVISCKDGSSVYYYRAIVEAHLRRHLELDEVVHHLNGDPTDDRLANLHVTDQRMHAHSHGHSWRTSRWPDRKCSGCGVDHDLLNESCKHCRQRHAMRAKATA